MKPRIVHVASGREWRGGQNQVRLLARALERQGEWNQAVVTGRGTILAERLAAAGVAVRACPWSTALDPRALLAVVREARGPAVLLHAHDAHALVLAGVAAAVTGSRLVATRRVDFHIRRPGFWSRADRVIAISNAIREILVIDGIPEDRIAVVHSGINLDEVRAAPSAGLRAMYHLAPNVPLAINVAALVPHKDHGTLIDAAVEVSRDLPQLHWVILGEGPRMPELSERIRQAGLEDRVHLAGHLANPWGAIGEADVFVLSSREEGLGTSVLDAMAKGVPVAATRAGGIPEMLEGGAGVLVPVGRGAQLGQAVHSLIQDKELRKRVVTEASARLSQFTDTAMADGIRSVYRSILPTG